MSHRHAFAVLFAVVLGVAAPAVAAPKNTPPHISIASVNGVQVTGLAPQQAPALGDTLTFATSGGSLAGWEYPMVAVSCYQDVNGDGLIDTNLLGPDVVYTWLDKPSAQYLLGAYSSIWTQRGGGPAECRADYAAYGWKSGKESVRVLDSYSFDATG